MCFGEQPAVKKASASLAQPTTSDLAFPFKKGDKVRVVRKVTSLSDGWKNAWVSAMDQAIGKTGVVIGIIQNDKDVSVDIPGVVSVYGYPSFGLELVNDSNPSQTTTIVTKPTQPETKHGFTVGQRVVNKFGDAGVVTGFEERFVQTRLDRQDYDTRWYPVSLRTEVVKPIVPVSTTLVSTTPVPVSRRSQALIAARDVAVRFSQIGPTRRITIDTVQAELEKIGFKSTELGNSAGVIFKGGQFRDTGVTVKSNRPGNRGRRVIVWEYIASPAPNGYIVEKSDNGGKTWNRSANTTKDGHNLYTHVFPTWEKANSEAVYQNSKRNGLQYQASPVA